MPDKDSMAMKAQLVYAQYLRLAFSAPKKRGRERRDKEARAC